MLYDWTIENYVDQFVIYGPIRVLIHMGIGCIVYTIVAYSVGWLGNISDIGQGILIVALQLSIALIIWLLFMAHYRKEAKKLNDKIQNMK